MTKLKFGSFVKVSQKMKRVHKPYKKENYYGTSFEIDYRYWEPQEIKETQCIFIGYRYLLNGDTVYLGGGVIRFIEHSRVKVALVVADERTNPFYAPIDAVNNGE